MFKYVLSMFLFGGLLGGGLIGGCGEDATPGSPLPSEGEGQGEGEGEDAPVEGEGEGSPNEGEGETGEGEGEGPLSPGADGEPCGQPSGGGNACQEGLECLTCEEGNAESVPDERSPGDTKPCEGRICTCPQWFGGAWWAEFEPRAVDYEYDFETVGGTEQQVWMDQEIPIQQKGCVVSGPSIADQVTILYNEAGYTEGKVSPPLPASTTRMAPLSEKAITGSHSRATSRQTISE